MVVRAAGIIEPPWYMVVRAAGKIEPHRWMVVRAAGRGAADELAPSHSVYADPKNPPQINVAWIKKCRLDSRRRGARGLRHTDGFSRVFEVSLQT